MTLSPSRVALATAGTFMVLYIGLVLLVMLVPTFYMQMIHSWHHGMMMATPIHVSPRSFFLGILTFTATGFLSGYVFVLLLNLGRPKPA